MPFDWMAAATLGAAGIGAFGASRANRRTFDDSAANRAFQERMSSTAYQRAAADKRAAGINPYYGLGAMSSTPGGSQAVAQNELSAVSSTALDVRRANAEIDNLREQNKKIAAETAATEVLKKVYEKDVQQKQASTRRTEQEIEAGAYNAAVGSAKGALVRSAIQVGKQIVDDVSKIKPGTKTKFGWSDWADKFNMKR